MNYLDAAKQALTGFGRPRAEANMECSMDIQTLLNSLITGGFHLAARDDDKLAILGPVALLTPEQTIAIRTHKAELLVLAPPQRPPGCIPYEQAERKAIQWADTDDADGALELALADWDQLEPWPPPCDRCGGIVFRWDALGNCHCVACSPGRSRASHDLEL
jgi:hypothetical protein